MADILNPMNMLQDSESTETTSLADILTVPDVSPDITTYLAHLTSLPLTELQEEPTTVSSSSAQLTNALTTLCYTSYPTFLALHSTTASLSSSLSSLSASLDALISALPSLEDESKKFVQETRETQKERSKASLVLEHHDKLQDVLSIPQLMDYCVRNHNYSEALLLSNHANTLSNRFPSNSLVQSIKAECDARVQAMLGQLLRVLNEQAKLPALFRAVGFLRKIEVFEEEELALAFLTGRGVYFDGVLKAVDLEKGIEGDKERDREACARYLKRYIDVWREGVYDVITQYTTIFLDRAPSSSTSSSTANLPPTRLHALLTAFTTHRMNSFISLLHDTLSMIPDPVLLTPLLTQVTYCANSFARVGMDFRSLLAPLFVDAVKQGVINHFQNAAEDWRRRLRGEVPSSGRDTSRQRPGKKPSQVLLASNISRSSAPQPSLSQLEAISSGPANVPPPILLSYPPLAIYTNAILTTLNGLRMLAPIELLNDLLDALEETLANSAAALLQLVRDRTWTATEEERREEEGVVKAGGTVYTKVFVPFMRRALIEGVYGISLDDVDGMGQTLAGALREWEAWLDVSKDQSDLAPVNGQ